MDEPITDQNEGIAFPDPNAVPDTAENGAFVDPAQPQPDMTNPPIDFSNMTPEEAMYREDIERKLSDVKARSAQVDEEITLSQSRIEMARKQVMNDLFSLMLESGVDPNNLEQLQNFFKVLEQENPDLLQMFEIGLDAMAGTPGQGGNLVPEGEDEQAPQETPEENFPPNPATGPNAPASPPASPEGENADILPPNPATGPQPIK